MNPLVSERRGAAAVLTLNDPARHNILSGELCRRLIDAVEAANADPGVRAIIVTGTAPSFCAGADLADLTAAAAGNTAAVHWVYDSFMAVAASPLPTIAAVNGAAIGAGLNLALACDLRLGGVGVRFETRFLNLGLHPGGGHAWLLNRAVGWSRAARMLLLGQVVEGPEALEIGLIERLMEPEQLQGAALAMVERLAAIPRELLLRTKASMRLAVESSHRTSFEHETREQAWSLAQPAFTERVARLRRRPGMSP